MNIPDLLRCETLSFQSYRVDAERLGVAVANGLGIGQHVLDNDGIAPDVSMSPDAAKLVNSGKGAYRRIIFNCDVASQRGRIGQDDVIAQDAVVSDVRRDHQKVMVSDFCMSASASGPAMDADELAKNVVGSDRKKCLFAAEFEILRLKSDSSEWKEMIVLPDGGRPFDNHVRVKSASIADSDAIPNSAVWSDDNIGADFSFGADDGGRVDHARRFRIADFGIRISETGIGTQRSSKSEIRNPKSAISFTVVDL